jgi:cell wall-associated NlpC family hydrolase
MPTSLRRLLPPFAIAAVGVACGAWALPSAPETAPQELPDKPAAIVDEAELDRPPLRVIPPPPTLGDRAAAIAVQAVGVPYRWGGSSPEAGFDCSGLVYWAYGRLGLDLPHSSYALYGLGRQVPRSRIKRGDLLFFSGLGHVGVYLGRGRMVHAPQSGKRVEVVELGGPYYGGAFVGARRLIRT